MNQCIKANIKTPLRTIEWIGGLDGYVSLIDQTRLPAELTMLEVRDERSMWEAIKRLSVRGAPAIGIAGAMGAVLGVREYEESGRDDFLKRLDEVCEFLATCRPTAVNLAWALNRMRDRARSGEASDIPGLKRLLLDEAKLIRDEDEAMCHAIGRHGEPLITPGAGILTHCNAGGLATACYGTALAPLYAAHERGKRFRVYVGETRPLLQGSRLTAWELQQAGIDPVVICDNTAGSLLRTGKVDLVITGADRISANGDVANKIGTYSLAVLAQAHGIPFYVAAPSSTFDLSMSEGTAIPIEERGAEEIRCGFGKVTAPAGVECYNPAFDVTPAGLIRGVITELGVIEPVGRDGIVAVLGSSGIGESACRDT